MSKCRKYYNLVAGSPCMHFGCDCSKPLQAVLNNGVHKRLDKGIAEDGLRMMNLRSIMSAHVCHPGSTAAFIFTSSRATRARQSSWMPRNLNEVASTHLSTPSTGVHRFHFVYALLSLYRSAFRSAAFVSINVLVSSCFTVTRVSCELRFLETPKADSIVLTNRKYGVATVWYAANCLVLVISSHFAGSSQHSVPNPA